MNLIRNGGFERMDVSFWSLTSDGALVYDNVEQYRGVGCAKLTASGAGNEYLWNQDYVEVNPYEVYILSTHVKSTAARAWKLVIAQYDESLVSVGSITMAAGTTEVGYSELTAQYSVPENVMYIRIYMQVTAPAIDEIFYFDVISIVAFEIINGVYNHGVIADLNAIDVSGDTRDSRFDKIAFLTYIMDLRVRSVAGVGPTLDVNVMEVDRNGSDVIVGTFVQKVATGHERIALVNPTGKQMYIKYVLGGNTPVFSFDLALTVKR